MNSCERGDVASALRFLHNGKFMVTHSFINCSLLEGKEEINDVAIGRSYYCTFRVVWFLVKNGFKLSGKFGKSSSTMTGLTFNDF